MIFIPFSISLQDNELVLHLFWDRGGCVIISSYNSMYVIDSIHCNYDLYWSSNCLIFDQGKQSWFLSLFDMILIILTDVERNSIFCFVLLCFVFLKIWMLSVLLGKWILEIHSFPRIFWYFVWSSVWFVGEYALEFVLLEENNGFYFLVYVTTQKESTFLSSKCRGIC